MHTPLKKTIIINMLLLNANAWALDKSLINMSLEQLMDVSIVSSASKYSQKTNYAPASIDVITAEDIQQYGYRNLAELLGSVRGFFGHYDSTYHGVGSRGFLPQGDYGSRILVLVDGHKMNEHFVGYPSWGEDFPINLDLIQRVEVVHGPSSSLYGTSAFFGVINIITKRAESIDGFEVSGELSEHRGRQGRVTYAEKLSNSTDLLISATSSTKSGTNLHFSDYDNPETGIYGIAHQRDNEAFQKAFIKLSLKDWVFSAAYSNREKGYPIPYLGMIFDAPNQGDDVRGFANLAWSHEFNENFSSLARLSYDYYHFHGKYYPLSSEDPPISLYTVEKDRSNWLKGEWQWQWHSEKQQIIGGFEFQKRHQMLSTKIDTFNEILIDKAISDKYWAAFLQYETHLNEQLTLNTGIRYDYYDHTRGTTNPRLALIYRFNDKNTLKLMAGNAFRAPNVFEAYNDDPSWIKSNLALKPETIRAYEATLEHQFAPKTQGIFSLYRYTVKDLIKLNFDPSDGLVFYDNIGKVNALGFDAEVSKQWESGLNVKLSYSYQKLEDALTREKISNSPLSLVKLRVGIPFGEQWFAGLDLNYRSHVMSYKPPYLTFPGFTESNLTITKKFSKNLAFSGSIYNLLGANYVYPLNNNFDPDRYIENERAFRLKFTYKF